MSNQLAFVLLLPLVLWTTFQGLLYIHAGQVTETVNLATFEGQKEASLQGYYSEDIKDEIKSFLVDGYNMDPDKIIVTATPISERKTRGERMSVCVSIPSPIINVVDVFTVSSNGDSSCDSEGVGEDQSYYKVEREIMSEYVDNGESL